jgi:hypothetical protein
VIPARPDRVPDGIEALIGYRAWRFAGAALLPITLRLTHETATAWDAANRDWVSAECPVMTPGVSPETVRRCLETIYQKLGYRPDLKLVRDPESHVVPDEGCSCGFYAMKTLRAVREPPGLDAILGRVELAGKVIECTAGYRAERARIVELIPIEGSEWEAIRLANHLGLPLSSAVPPWHERNAWIPIPE